MLKRIKYVTSWRDRIAARFGHLDDVLIGRIATYEKDNRHGLRRGSFQRGAFEDADGKPVSVIIDKDELDLAIEDYITVLREMKRKLK